MTVRQSYTINQFSVAYKVGRTRLYDEIKSGRLMTYRVGRRRYISAQAASEWQAKLESEASRNVGA